MSLFRVRLFRVSLAGCLMGVSVFAASNPTFHKDVLPILQRNCQSCHRTGEVAPMSLLTYGEARPWAKAIKAAVLSKKMPPWFADPQYGHFTNDRRLQQADIDTLSAWADSGAPEGDAKDSPAPLKFVDGWSIKPDMVIEMPEPYQLPATGTMNWKYMRVKGNFPEDVWVTSGEMRAGNNAVLHHGKVWVVPPGSKWMANAKYGVAYEGKDAAGNLPGDGSDILGKFNPGLGAQRFDMDGAAKLIKKGSDLVFELHYTPVGKPTADLSKVGIVFAKNPPEKRYFLSRGSPLSANLVIPPGERDQEVASEVTFDQAVKLVYIQPHMHVRGKDYELRLAYPSGETHTVFKGKFDFEWQLGYDLKEPLLLPKGTKMIGIAHFDNSANNPFNPDPKATVYWGEQNWDEMQSVFVGYVIDRNVDPDAVFHASGVSLLPRGKPGPTLEAASAR